MVTVRERAASLVALVIVAVAVGVTIRYNSFIPWGTDSAAYLSAARGWDRAELFTPASFLFRFPWASNEYVEAPLGHRGGPERGTLTSFYPLGYPLLLATALRIGGEMAPHLVAPICVGVLAWCGFLIGRQVASGWAGVMAALMIAASPVTASAAVIPMSDVPAAAFWALSWVLGLRRGLVATIAAGLCAAVAVMIRPNLAPLALIFAVSTAAADPVSLRRGFVRFLAFGAAAFVGPLLVMWSQAVLYGGPFTSGYPASLDFFFQTDRIPYNARFYPRQFVALHTALPFAGVLVAPLLTRGWRRDATRTRAALIVWTAVSVIAINMALYLAYLTFTNWQTLRFMLPAMLALFLLFAAALDRARQWIAQRQRWLALIAAIPVLPVVFGPRQEIGNVLTEAVAHRRLDLMGRYLHEALPANAVIFTFVHGGALALYTGRPIIRLDLIAPSALEQALIDLRRGGLRPVFVLDVAFEHATLKELLASVPAIALEWLPRAEFATSLSVMYHDAADREAFASGERWPVDVLLSRYDEPHPAWWRIRRPPNERVILPPIDESWAFRTALEASYRRVLNREERPLRVRHHASVLWTRRYLRYRLNGCTHADATDKVFRQQRGEPMPPLCVSTGPLTFPPRNETVEFRRQLEAAAPADAADAPSFVDVEGEAVWLQEYLERRLNGCTHDAATTAVLGAIEGRVASPCVPAAP
jgi:hypothetical protein